MTLAGRPFGMRRVVGACTALLLLAVQVFGAALAPPLVWDLDPDRIEICTRAGMVVLGPDGQPDSSLPAGHGAPCLFCLPLLHGGAPPSAPVFFPVSKPPERVEHQGPAALSVAAVLSPLDGAATPQAPPAFL